MDIVVLSLTELAAGIPALTSALGSMLAEAASVCLNVQGHEAPCLLDIQFKTQQYQFYLHRMEVSISMLRAYRDLQEATEFGACGVAILLAREVLGYTAIERSAKGTGFDYWLGTISEANDAAEPFERKARLEVSGILQGEEDVVEARVREKVRQTMRSAGEYPACVIVVEFGRPLARMEMK